MGAGIEALGAPGAREPCPDLDAAGLRVLPTPFSVSVVSVSCTRGPFRLGLRFSLRPHLHPCALSHLHRRAAAAAAAGRLRGRGGGGSQEGGVIMLIVS